MNPWEGIDYTVKNSPELNVLFYRVLPLCSAFGIPCDFNHDTQLSLRPFADSSMDLTKALYPIDPAMVHYDVNFNSTSLGVGVADVLNGPQTAEKLCANPAPGVPVIEDKKYCYSVVAAMLDTLRVSEMAELEDAVIPGPTPKNRRYIGVVGSDGGGLPSYFKYILNAFGSTDWAGTVGFAPGNVPNTVLVEKGADLSVPHELVHSFRVRYGMNSDDHQDEDLRTSGVWVTRSEMPIYSADSTFSFMRGELGINPISNHWMDSETYSKLYNKMNASLLKRAQIVGNEWFISGLVGGNGQIAFNDVYTGVKVGLREVSGNGLININSFNPSGELLDAISLPVDFSVSIERAGGAISNEMPFAPLSTGFPDHPDTLSVNISSMSGTVSSFYPITETLRTHVRNLADNAFIGDPSTSRSELNSVLSNAEQMLRANQLFLASQALSSQFSSSIITKVREDYSGVSSREKILEASNSFGLRLVALSQRFSTIENRILRVQHKNPGLAQGERAEFKVSSLIFPANPEIELFLMADFNGQAQRVVAKPNAWVLTTSPTSSGENEAIFSLFQQNRRMAKALQQAIDSYSMEKYNLEKILREETDPERIEEVMAKIEELAAKILDLRAQLAGGRRQLGEALVFKFNAN